MSTSTATIFIGYAHQNDSGIVPSHLILFTENSRPAIILQSIDKPGNTKVVIPTVGNTIDDIYLTIAVYILKAIKPPRPLSNKRRDSLHEIFEKTELAELYNATSMVLKDKELKVVFNILDNSLLLSLVHEIKKYPVDVEITLPAFKREYDAWAGKVILKEN
jgi:hypothetical protein